MMQRQLAASPTRLTYYSKTKLAKGIALPPQWTYVHSWSFAFGVAGAALGMAFGIILNHFVTRWLTGTLPENDELVRYMRYFGLAFFGLFYAYGLVTRAKAWEFLARETEEQEYSTDTMESVQRPISNYAQRGKQTPMPQGTYPKNQQDMAKLYYILVNNADENGRWKFVRDVVAKAKVFPNITSNWDAIEGWWEEMGYVKDKRVTDEGKHWIEANVPVGELD